MARRSLVAFQLPEPDARLLRKEARRLRTTVSALIRLYLEPMLDGERTANQLKTTDGNN